MTPLDEITFDETVGTEIQGWITNLPGDTLDKALEELELTKSGTQFAKADRLYRRLRGDYTANDFARTEEKEDDADIFHRRNEKLIAMAQNLPFSNRTIAEMATRRNATARIHGAQDRHSSTPLTQAQILPDPVDMSLTVTQENNAIALPVTTASTTGGISGTQNTSCATQNPRRTNAEHIFRPSSTTQPTWANTLTTTTTTSCTTMATTASTHTVHSTPQSVFTTRQMTSPNDAVQCTLSDGKTYTMPRAVACELARVQAIAGEYDKEMRSLQGQMAELIESTRTHAIRNSTERTEANSQRPRNVNFQDTYRLEYIHEDDPISDLRNSQPRAHMQQTSALNARAQNFVPNQDYPPQRGPRQAPQTHAVEQHEPWGRGNHQSNSRSRYSGDGTTLQHSMNLDVGRTVRQWKLQFSGEKGSSIEEFIERVNECRSLAHIADEDLLNAMSELTSGVARHWCRQARKNWRTWEDFCAAARRCYGVDKRFQQRLVSEAHARTQGKEEPVRDYIICLLTILSRFEEPWEDERQLEHIYRNMLPALQRMVPRERVTDIDTLMELAREAEALRDAERNYKPPPCPGDCLLPDVAYKGPKPAKPLPQRQKGNSLAAMAESAPSHTKETRGEANADKPSLAALADHSPQALESLISRLLDEKLAKVTLGREQASNSPPRRSGPTRNSGANRKSTPQSPEERKDAPSGGKGKATYTPPTPDSDKNRNKSPGPKEHVRCWGCSWPGHIKPTCPECSGKGRGSE